MTASPFWRAAAPDRRDGPLISGPTLASSQPAPDRPAGSKTRVGDHVDPSSAPEAPAGPHRNPRGRPARTPAVSPDEVTWSAPASTTLYLQETAAGELAARVLGAAVRPSDTGELTLVYPHGRRAALQEVTVGDRADLRLAHLRRESELQWPAPAC